VKTAGFFYSHTSSLLVSAGNKKIPAFANAKWDFAEASHLRDARNEVEGILRNSKRNTSFQYFPKRQACL
tara:strand:+ start:3370 stop:3579 length:210 start_codon:yes stop_codon:yes gene_type:complete